MLHTCGRGRAGCEARVQQAVASPAVQRRQGLQRQPQHRAVRQRLRAAALVEVLALVSGTWAAYSSARCSGRVCSSAEGCAARCTALCLVGHADA